MRRQSAAQNVIYPFGPSREACYAWFIRIFNHDVNVMTRRNSLNGSVRQTPVVTPLAGPARLFEQIAGQPRAANSTIALRAFMRGTALLARQRSPVCSRRGVTTTGRSLEIPNSVLPISYPFHDAFAGTFRTATFPKRSNTSPHPAQPRFTLRIAARSRRPDSRGTEWNHA